MCIPGHFKSQFNSKDTCELCPQGRYTDAKDQTFCKFCPEGQYGSESGASRCLACGVGTYTDKKGRLECEPCDPGYSQPLTGSFGCIACPEGHFAEQNRASVCSKCPAGTEAQSKSSAKCTTCETGRYQVHTPTFIRLHIENIKMYTLFSNQSISQLPTAHRSPPGFRWRHALQAVPEGYIREHYRTHCLHKMSGGKVQH